MSKARLFSTKIRFVIMVEPVGGDMLNDCIFLLKAADFKKCFCEIIKYWLGSSKRILEFRRKSCPMEIYGNNFY